MIERRKGPPRVKFERPLEARVVPADGTCIVECLVIELSETGAQLQLPLSHADLTDFYLVLSRFGVPVYRRCQTAWVKGSFLGVAFRGTPVASRTT